VALAGSGGQRLVLAWLAPRSGPGGGAAIVVLVRDARRTYTALISLAAGSHAAGW